MLKNCHVGRQGGQSSDDRLLLLFASDSYPTLTVLAQFFPSLSLTSFLAYTACTSELPSSADSLRGFFFSNSTAYKAFPLFLLNSTQATVVALSSFP